MKKKLLAVVLGLFVMGTSSVFAMGIGGQAGWPMGVAFTYKMDDVDDIIAVNLTSNASGVAFGLYDDYWFVNQNIPSLLNGMLNYFVGAGAYCEFVLNESYMDFGLFARVVGGVNAFFLADDFLEVYFQIGIMPGYGATLWWSTLTDSSSFRFKIGADVGARIWLR